MVEETRPIPTALVDGFGPGPAAHILRPELRAEGLLGVGAGSRRFTVLHTTICGWPFELVEGPSSLTARRWKAGWPRSNPSPWSPTW